MSIICLFTDNLTRSTVELMAEGDRYLVRVTSEAENLYEASDRREAAIFFVAAIAHILSVSDVDLATTYSRLTLGGGGHASSETN